MGVESIDPVALEQLIARKVPIVVQNGLRFVPWKALSRGHFLKDKIKERLDDFIG